MEKGYHETKGTMEGLHLWEACSPQAGPQLAGTPRPPGQGPALCRVLTGCACRASTGIPQPAGGLPLLLLPTPWPTGRHAGHWATLSRLMSCPTSPVLAPWVSFWPGCKGKASQETERHVIIAGVVNRKIQHP